MSEVTIPSFDPNDGGIGIPEASEPRWVTVDLVNDLTWVDTAGKLDISDADIGEFVVLAHTSGTLGRNMPFGYVEVHDVDGADHVDSIVAIDVVLTANDTVPGGSGGDTAMFAGVISDTTLATTPGYFAGMQWNSVRSSCKTIMGQLGAAIATGADGGGLGDNVRTAWCSFHFAGSGLNSAECTFKASSQYNIRSFQAHNDKMYLVLAFSGGGTESDWDGVTMKYKLTLAPS